MYVKRVKKVLMCYQECVWSEVQAESKHYVIWCKSIFSLVEVDAVLFELVFIISKNPIKFPKIASFQFCLQFQVANCLRKR